MKNSKILIVEDEFVNRELLTYSINTIEDMEIYIDVAKSGEEALKLLKDNFYDTILLDIFLDGEIDGFDILKKVRSHELTADIPVLVVTSDTELKHKALKLSASDFISKPFDIEALKLRVKNYIKHYQTLKKLKSRSTSLEEELAGKLEQLKESLSLAKETEYEISLRLAKASEFRDLETGMHIKRMSLYSRLLSRVAGLSSQDQELIFRASPLHDIGKIGIVDSILLKPGKLTIDEFDIMKKHTTIGGEILEGSDKYPVLEYGKIIAEQHHEKWDGSGYPKGLKGKDIHIFARIVAIADVFDALSSKRVYKPSIPLSKVIAIMKEGRGTHFDPELFDHFFDNLYLFIGIKETYRDNSTLDEPTNLDTVRT